MSILGKDLLEYTLESAKRIESIMSGVSVVAPKFDGAEEDSAATNSLDDVYINSLKNKDHLQPSYLESYYSNIAVA